MRRTARRTPAPAGTNTWASVLPEVRGPVQAGGAPCRSGGAGRDPAPIPAGDRPQERSPGADPAGRSLPGTFHRTGSRGESAPRNVPPDRIPRGDRTPERSPGPDPEGRSLPGTFPRTGSRGEIAPGNVPPELIPRGDGSQERSPGLDPGGRSSPGTFPRTGSRGKSPHRAAPRSRCPGEISLHGSLDPNARLGQPATVEGAWPIC